MFLAVSRSLSFKQQSVIFTPKLLSTSSDSIPSVCFPVTLGGGRVVRCCWVNFQCWGVLQFGYSRARAYCARSRCGWGCLDIFTLVYPFSPLSPSLWETARYRLKYCLKGPLNPKQPTNQPTLSHWRCD